MSERQKTFNQTQETRIEIVNNCQNDTVTLTGHIFDKRDFDGSGNPETQFKKLKLKPGTKVNRRAEVEVSSLFSPWTMTFDFHQCVDTIWVCQQCCFDKHIDIDFRILSGNCSGRYQYDPVVNLDNHTVTIKVRDSDKHLLMLLQQYLDKMKKLHKYLEAANELVKLLNSKAAMESEKYRKALNAAIDDLQDNQIAYDLLNDAINLAAAKEFEKALDQLKLAERACKDNNLQIEISKQTETVLAQKDEAKVQELMKEADDLAKKKEYEKALEKYAAAEYLTHSTDTLNKISEKTRQIRENIDNEYAKELQTEGDKALAQGDYEGARAKYKRSFNVTHNKKLQDTLKETIEKSYNMQATQFKEKADSLVAQGNTAGAIELYEKSLGYASCANDDKLINSIKEGMSTIGDGIAQKLRTEAINENDFDRKLARLLDAKAYAKEPALTQSIDNDIQTAYEKEAMRLQNQGNNLVQQGKFEEGDQSFDIALIMTKDQKTKQSILLDKMNASKKHMELALESGQKLASQNKYEAALAKYSEAMASATDGADLISIIKDKSKTLDKQNEMLQKQTKEMIRQNQFIEAKALLEDVMKYTTDSRQLSLIVKSQMDIATKQTDFLQSEANKLAAQNNFKDAHKLLDQAQTVAVTCEKSRSIDADRANILKMEASYLLDNTVGYESSHDSDEIGIDEEVEKRLKKVEELYLTAQKLNPSKDLRKSLRALDYKIEGNEYMKQARKLDNGSEELLKAANDSKVFDNLGEAQNKCKAAMELIEKAEYSFKNGSKINKKIFKDSVDDAFEEKKIAKNISDKINSLKLKRNYNKLQEEKLKLAFDEKIIEEKRKEEENVKEQREVNYEKPLLIIDN